MPIIKVALLGFGNVSRAFCRYAARAATESALDLRIAAVADSSGGIALEDPAQLEGLLALKQSGRSIRQCAGADALLNHRRFVESLPSAGVSVLVESLPTDLDDGEPALGLLTAALAQGTAVVTVDKGPLVHGFDQLMGAARAGNCRLAFNGTTGVRVPEAVRGERVLEIRGILTGTTNYLLTEMQDRAISFEDALAKARESGIAEPNPQLDVEGWDTASKTLILAKALMGARTSLSEVSRIGIGAEIQQLIETGRSSGRRVRLVGRARIWEGRVRVSVAPKLVGPDSPFYQVSGTSKAAQFRTEGKGEILSFARSSREAISSTIFDDVLEVAGVTAATRDR